MRVKKFNKEDTNLVLNYLLEKINALPIQQALVLDANGQPQIRGRNLSTQT